MIELEPFSGWFTKKELGSGTFSTVYLAEKNGTYSAIKQIIIPNSTKYNLDFSRLRGDTSEIKRFYMPEIDRMMKEVKLLSNLSGIPGIVIYQDHILREYKMRAGWEILIRMEYLKPLDKYINEKGITIREILQMGINLTYALYACYEEGILHRDIKEGNILVDSRGNFKLCDFGVSKYLNGDTHAFTITGTYGYMAPEVEKGFKYDFRADMYSLGIVLYKLLNNYMMPFSSLSDSNTDREHNKLKLLDGKAIPKPANGNEQISRVILKACKFNPKHRYNNFLEFNEVLKTLLKKTDPKLLDFQAIKPIGELNPFSNIENSYSNSLPDNFITDLPRKDNILRKFISENKIEKKEYTNKTDKKNLIKSWINKNKPYLIIILHILIFLSLSIVLFSVYTLYKNNNAEDKIPVESILPNSCIKFGTYLDEPILWECQAVHPEGTLFISKYILCLKSFDSAEGNEKETSTTVDLYGSNKWENSNIRDWLNSKEKTVEFTSNKPDLNSVWKGYNPYSDEKGFLNGFTENELSMIKTHNHEQVKDKVFLLSKYEILLIWSLKDKRQKTPTKSAVKNSDFTKENLSYDYTWWYWTRDASNNDTYSVNFIDGDGSYNSFQNAANGSLGVLPAIYIDNAQISSGDGSDKNPYILE